MHYVCYKLTTTDSLNKRLSDELKQNRKRQSEWTHTKKTHKLSNIKMIDGKRQIETRHSHFESL